MQVPIETRKSVCAIIHSSTHVHTICKKKKKKKALSAVVYANGLDLAKENKGKWLIRPSPTYLSPIVRMGCQWAPAINGRCRRLPPLQSQWELLFYALSVGWRANAYSANDCAHKMGLAHEMFTVSCVYC